MKCIRTKSGKIERLPDFQAAALVERGLAVYVAKNEWKASTRKKGSTIHTATASKIAPRPASRDENRDSA